MITGEGCVAYLRLKRVNLEGGGLLDDYVESFHFTVTVWERQYAAGTPRVSRLIRLGD